MASKENPKVIIVGADMSGLSAGKVLSEAGIKDLLILEATSRIGGRVKKANFSGLSIELGANWVEGVGSKTTVNPIWPMAKKLNLRNFYSDFDNISANIYQQVGGLYGKAEAQKTFDMADKLEEFSENVTAFLDAHNLGDVSILTAQRLMNYVPSTPLEMAIDYLKYDFESAEPSRITSIPHSGGTDRHFLSYTRIVYTQNLSKIHLDLIGRRSAQSSWKLIMNLKIK